MRNRAGWRWPAVSLLTLLVIAVVWWILTTATGTIRSLFFPAPEAVWARLVILKGTLLTDSLATLVRVLVSWLVGSLLGVAVGLAMGRTKLVYHVANPIIEALRPVPPVALIPFVILWFGIGESGKLFLGGLGCFMVMVVNTLVASKNVPLVFARAARSLGASENQVYSTVVLPSIVPYLVAGLRVGIALDFGLTVAAEFMGAKSGIGALIMLASRTLNTDVVLLGTIVIGLEAFAVERLIALVAGIMTRWAETPEATAV